VTRMRRVTQSPSHASPSPWKINSDRRSPLSTVRRRSPARSPWSVLLSLASAMSSEAAREGDTALHHLSLDTLPTDILDELAPYLDTGDLVSLAQVNRRLRSYFVCNHSLWAYRLHTRMQVKRGRRSKRTPYEDVVNRIPTRRCQSCNGLEQRPWKHGLFKRRLCSVCRQLPQFVMITATTAKQEYFLNDKDLEPLRVLSVRNPHYGSMPSMRLYCLKDVQAASEAKLKANQTTMVERRRKSLELGEQIKKRKIAASETRRIALQKALAAFGLQAPLDWEICHHFITNNRKSWHEKLQLEDVVQKVLRVHYLENHSCHDDICRYYPEIPPQCMEVEALEFLEGVEKDMALNNLNVSLCPCGRPNLQEQVKELWQERTPDLLGY
jgi:XPA protein C-terminus